MDLPSGDSVFTLLTDLCNNIVTKDATVPPSKVSKLRSQAYEIILSNKTKPSTPTTSSVMDLLHCYYVLNEKVRTVAEYKNKEKLKQVIDNQLKSEQRESNEDFHRVLKLLVLLSSTDKDFSEENYQNPFSYGVTDLMNPKPKLEFGLAQPFSCYPPHMFQLPFSLRKQNEPENPYQCSTQYTIQNFGPWSYLPAELRQDIAELKTLASPMMLASLTSSHCTPYTNPVLDSRLSGPRDLSIPGLFSSNEKVPQVTPSSTTSVEVKEMYRASDTTVNTGVEIWDLASRLHEYIPDDIWETAAKMSQDEYSQRSQKPDLSKAHALTEQQFLYIITGLAFGVESITSSVQPGMLFEISNSLVILFEWELNELKALGLYHKRIYDFAFNQHARESVINLATRAALVEYVIEFRAKLLDVLSVCGDAEQWVSFVVHKMSPLTKEVIFIGKLLRVRGADIRLMNSNAMMSYLSKEIMKPLNGSYSASVAKILVAICKVYFKFIELFIFESNIEDHFGDFFIESNLRCEQSRTSDFWNGVFRFSRKIKVPDFLKNLSRSIMLCGKTLRLLKICKPKDPLLHLISADYPKIRCCTSYEQLAGRRQELDVYRSRCRFVTGEPVTLEHMLLEREAERQACAELAALKQAETIDRIAAERKRLIQLLVAEKKHSLRVLKAAMQEAKASKQNARERARSARELEAAAQSASDDVDTWIRDTEKKEMMEYYSRLSGEVGKCKIHTEWRFKRLELNQRRVELLMSEERSVKRVRSELSTAPDVFLHVCDTAASSTAAASTPATPMAAAPTAVTPIMSDAPLPDTIPNAPIKINLKLAYGGTPTTFSPAAPTTISPITPSADCHFISPMALPECGKHYGTQKTSTPYTTESDDAKTEHLNTMDEQGNFIPSTSVKSSNIVGKDFNEANDNQQIPQTSKPVSTVHDVFLHVSDTPASSTAAASSPATPMAAAPTVLTPTAVTPIMSVAPLPETIPNAPIKINLKLAYGGTPTMFSQAAPTTISPITPSADCHFISPMALPECGKDYGTQKTSTPYTTDSDDAKTDHLNTIDEQRNFIPSTSVKSSNVVGKDLNEANDNIQIPQTSKPVSTVHDVFLHVCDTAASSTAAASTPATPMAAAPTVLTPTAVTPIMSVAPLPDTIPNAPIKINLKLAYGGTPTMFSQAAPTTISPITPSADCHFISPMALPECGKHYGTQKTSTPYTTESDDAKTDHLNTMDEQGNFIPSTSVKSSNVIGQDLNKANANEQFLQIRKQAMLNKQAVMAHEFGKDVENNLAPLAPLTRHDYENNLAELTPTQEALRNKLKVLGDEFGEAAPETRPAREPRTAAMREALINKHKILGAEYHLPGENVTKRVPVNDAQKNAQTNRNKALTSDMEAWLTFNSVATSSEMADKVLADLPVINISSASASPDMNKPTICETTYVKATAVPVIDISSASASPDMNKPTICETTYVKATAVPVINISSASASPDLNKPTICETTYVKATAVPVINISSASASPDLNKPTICETTYVKATAVPVINISSASASPDLNKPTICETTYVKATAVPVINISSASASPDLNKPTICETTYVTATAVPVINISSPSEHGAGSVSGESPNRSGLKLDLPKSFNNSFVTPKCTVEQDVATPCVAFATPVFSNTQLKVETPLCQDINLFKSPKTPETEKCQELKLSYPHYNDGFLYVNEEVNEMMANDDESSVLMSPEKSSGSPKARIMNGSSEFTSIDPFGRRQIGLGLEARAAGDGPPGYSDFAELMKNPSKFFSLACSQENKNEWNGMSSLVSCLHESVHQPLVYQLEILNNSVLVHYLVDLDMYGHLCFLKDHFLLLDGCFSGSLCSSLFSRLATAACPAELLSFASLDGMLDAALGYSESRDKYSDNLRLLARQPPLSIQHSSPDALQCLTLCYRVEWPLNIVLSTETMQRYLKTFQFLLKMKRISWVLVQDFEYLKRQLVIPRECAQKLRRSPHYVTLQNHRHIMATLVTALDNYITLSCLLASWREYVSELKKAATLDDLVTSHAAYIKKVQFRCLMNKRSTPVMQLINDIFTVILKYSRVLQAGHWHSTGGPYEHENYDRLKDLFLIFKQLWAYLYKVVSQLRECNYQPELFEDLMTTINFNGYIADPKPKENEVKKPFSFDDLAKKQRYLKTKPSYM